MPIGLQLMLYFESVRIIRGVRSIGSVSSTRTIAYDNFQIEVSEETVKPSQCCLRTMSSARLFVCTPGHRSAIFLVKFRQFT